jgi:protein Mpv17
MGIMEGHGKEAIKRKYVELFPTAIVSNWKVWPLIQVSGKQPSSAFD